MKCNVQLILSTSKSLPYDIEFKYHLVNRSNGSVGSSYNNTSVLVSQGSSGEIFNGIVSTSTSGTQSTFEPDLHIITILDFSSYDLSFRIIPTAIALYEDSFTYLGEYIYNTNINYLPVSDDYMGTSFEHCPIKYVYPLDNTDGDRLVWYNYNGEILFRDLYTGLIYALNSSGEFYQWN